MTQSTPPSKAVLRQQLRQQRRRLTPAQQEQAAQGLRRQLLHIPQFINANDIAFYIANDGELDVWPALLQARAMGKRTYLPVLAPTHPGELIFAPYRPGDSMILNRYGIPEPQHLPDRLRPWWTLNVVLTPLVGFTEKGDRLGMGGGFYDKTLSSRNRRPVHPVLVGTAHECQKVDRLPREPWDIPLDAVATDQEIYGALAQAEFRRPRH